MAPADGAPDTSRRSATAMPRGLQLSPRERQVVKFIVNGCSNQEIADCLGLRLQTVKNHLLRQPILDSPGSGIIGILTKVDNGQRYFLLQAKAEPGNKGVVQIGPTVQFTPGNYIGNTKLPKPFLFDEFCHPGVFPLLYESVQSEEGARFYKEVHIHRILSFPQGSLLDISPEYRWVSQPALHFS